MGETPASWEWIPALLLPAFVFGLIFYLRNKK